MSVKAMPLSSEPVDQGMVEAFMRFELQTPGARGQVGPVGENRHIASIALRYRFIDSECVGRRPGREERHHPDPLARHADGGELAGEMRRTRAKPVPVSEPIAQCFAHQRWRVEPGYQRQINREHRGQIFAHVVEGNGQRRFVFVDPFQMSQRAPADRIVGKAIAPIDADPFGRFGECAYALRESGRRRQGEPHDLDVIPIRRRRGSIACGQPGFNGPERFRPPAHRPLASVLEHRAERVHVAGLHPGPGQQAVGNHVTGFGNQELGQPLAQRFR